MSAPTEGASGLVGPPVLSHDEVQRIEGLLGEQTPLVEATRFNALAATFASSSRLDPYELVRELAACSSEVAALLRTDLGLLRPCRLHEHTQGVLDGFERDYVGLFPGSRNRRMLRMTLLLQDIGKSLCVSVTGSNLEQADFNQRVAENLLMTLVPDTMSRAETAAVRLLLAHDIIGDALQGRFDWRELQHLRDEWPPSLVLELDDLMLMAYLADAGAHTEHRAYRDADTLELRPCIVPGDEALSWLFERGPADRLVLRVPEHRRIVWALLPSLRATRSLVPSPSRGSAPVSGASAAASFERVASVPGAWSTELAVGSVPFPVLRETLMELAREHEFPVSAFVRVRWEIASAITLVREPSVTFDPPSVARCEDAVEQLIRKTGWQRRESTRPGTGVTLLMGLREGDDAGSRTHRPYEALARLLARAHEWHTATAQLVSARAVEGELQWYDQPGIVISARPSLLRFVTDLAHELGQQSVAVTDAEAGCTYSLRRSRPADA